ncbi:excinuclease ABC subunit UvrA [bacterium]|nr:excinuclease ABC subunit UvrA [bacterium]
MTDNWIRIRGARVHNLKNIQVDIPRDKLVVVTGLSGSGKSSLAFDTIYSEGQRRYLESLSSYARQFIGEMRKPDVDQIEGLSPTIAITQHSGSRNPRSTVGTMTEIYDYLRLLYARIGIPHCPSCGKEIRRQSIDQMIDIVMEQFMNRKIQILAPIVREKKGEFKQMWVDLRKKGFVRVLVDEIAYDLDEDIPLKKTEKHSVSVIMDRLRVSMGEKSRIVDSMEQALQMTKGLVEVLVQNDQEEWETMLFSENFACPDCGINIPEIEPRLFSFNSPFGACQSCDGLGFINEVDPTMIIPNPALSVGEGAIQIPGFRNYIDNYSMRFIEKILNYHGETKDIPFEQLKEETRKAVFYGEKRYEGLVPMIERRYRETGSDMARFEYEKLMVRKTCPECHGSRLKKEAMAVTIQGKDIHKLTSYSLRIIQQFFQNLLLTSTEKIIAERVIKEITLRLQFIIDVGLDYLTLSRSSASLSGGEAQRLRLASQVGSGLVGVLYVLDEPSIGLHPKDNDKLLTTLVHLRDIGNSLIIVEHDEETIRKADYIVDVGPGAGRHGGEIIYAGPFKGLLQCKRSITAQYLNKQEQIPLPDKRREGNGKQLLLTGAEEHNLQNVDVSFPLGTMICVTGVSGSGKSTLIHDILYRALAKQLYRSKEEPGRYDTLEGIEHVSRVIIVDQSPIGRTPRSNPATYIGLWTEIRSLYAMLPESKMKGYQQGRFSFNVKGGRCEACQGDGVKKVEMQFLPDVYVPCEVCEGKRFNRETLEVKFKNYSIYDILEMTVDDSLELFQHFPIIKRKLTLLKEVGLEYIKLGQPASTLSGGEAQRIKLALELSRKPDGRSLYILDEPTTGLHFADIRKLLSVLDQLVKTGNTVIIIEHNLDVVKTADYVIDLGPGGGEYGGKVVATGTPEAISRQKNSFTGQYLKKMLYDLS